MTLMMTAGGVLTFYSRALVGDQRTYWGTVSTFYAVFTYSVCQLVPRYYVVTVSTYLRGYIGTYIVYIIGSRNLPS